MMELDQLLYATRIFFLFGIVVMLGWVYKAPKDPAKHDWWASTIATMLAAVSFAWATANLITWSPTIATIREGLATCFVGMVFAWTVWARGNVAKMIRRS